MTVQEILVKSNAKLSPEFKELLSLLTPDDQLLLMSQSYMKKCKPGSLMYQEGQALDDLLFLNKGKVKIYKRGSSSKNQIIRLIKEGWFFGYRALLAEDRCYQATAEVFEEAEVIAISKDIINELIQRNHKLSTLFIHILAADLAKSNEHTLALTQKHLRGRLANAILLLADTYGFDEDGKTLSAQMTRGDLAELANMNIANTSRVLSEFAGEGIVTVIRRKIIIENEIALQHISNIG